MKHSDSISELAAALAKAQGSICNASKDSTGQSGLKKYRYATLASVFDACRDSLSKNNLAVTQDSEVNGATVVVHTMLLHSSGQFLENDLMLPITDKTEKGIGSAITYGRRYALAAMVGVAPEDDDGPSGKPDAAKLTCTNDHVKNILQLCLDLEITQRMHKDEISKRYGTEDTAALTPYQAIETIRVYEARIAEKKKLSSGSLPSPVMPVGVPPSSQPGGEEGKTLQEAMTSEGYGKQPDSVSPPPASGPSREQLLTLVAARDRLFAARGLLDVPSNLGGRNDLWAKLLGVFKVKTARELSPADADRLADLVNKKAAYEEDATAEKSATAETGGIFHPADPSDEAPF